MLQAQDIYVLLKIACLKDRDWTFRMLADELFLSMSQIHLALRRTSEVGLYLKNRKRVNLKALEELLVHGVKYVYPPERGALSYGIATAYAAPPLNRTIVQTNDPPPVWPSETGDRVGYSITPLHPNAPRAALLDQEFYELMALVDAIREGRARERQLAEKELHSRLSHKN
jgi:hypothetical protein